MTEPQVSPERFCEVAANSTVRPLNDAEYTDLLAYVRQERAACEAAERRHRFTQSMLAQADAGWRREWARAEDSWRAVGDEADALLSEARKSLSSLGLYNVRWLRKQERERLADIGVRIWEYQQRAHTPSAQAVSVDGPHGALLDSQAPDGQETLTCDINELSGWLDACLDGLGRTESSIEWLRDFRSAQTGQERESTT